MDLAACHLELIVTHQLIKLLKFLLKFVPIDRLDTFQVEIEDYPCSISPDFFEWN